MQIDRNKLESLVKALELRGEFVIFGSVPLLVHGLLTVINDIDIVASAFAWEKVKTFGELVRGEKGDNVLRLGVLDIYDGWMGEDVNSLIERATFADGLPYATLEDVLGYKQKLKRPKDALHISIVQKYLRSRFA